MTDLEAHVSKPGRDKLVKKVREKINELGVTYIFFQFISVTGRVVGKGIPADHWERTCEKGFQLVYGATANLFVDRLSLIHISEPTRRTPISYAVFCLKKKRRASGAAG